MRGLPAKLFFFTLILLAGAFALWQDSRHDETRAKLDAEAMTRRPDAADGGRRDPRDAFPAAPLGRGPKIDAEDLRLTRRAALQTGLALMAGAGFAELPTAARGEDMTMLTRPIPSSGQQLPVIGVGTWQGFDVGAGSSERAPLADVLKALYAAGGSVVDSSPMYGRSEAVAGDLIESLKARDKTFIATKVWTSGKAAGIAQMEQSMALFKTKTIDLMQVHNLLDYKAHLDTLNSWKKDGRVKYIGVTHYTASAFPQLEAVLRAEKLDFVQLNYAADDRAAEKTLLPLAHDKGIAVLVNRPFGGGGLMRRLKGAPLPDFAAEIGATSWAQLLLKFIVAHPAVTCAIPGTAKPEHMADNVKAGFGALPDAALRERIAKAVG